jgi:hypothetical protein
MGDKPKEMTWEDVMKLLDSVPYCFCTHCKHDPKFGTCDLCWCHNKLNAADKEELNMANYRLTFEQKVVAIQSLLNVGNSITWHYNTHGFGAEEPDWYCHADRLEISDGAILRAVMGHGATAELALDGMWTEMAGLKGDERIVINSYRDDRRSVRWNGFMWEPFTELHLTGATQPKRNR